MTKLFFFKLSYTYSITNLFFYQKIIFIDKTLINFFENY